MTSLTHLTPEQKLLFTVTGLTPSAYLSLGLVDKMFSSQSIVHDCSLFVSERRNPLFTAVCIRTSQSIVHGCLYQNVAIHCSRMFVSERRNPLFTAVCIRTFTADIPEYWWPCLLQYRYSSLLLTGVRVLIGIYSIQFNSNRF